MYLRHKSFIKIQKTMTIVEILFIGAIHIVLFVMLFTLQKISELRSKNILIKKEVLLYTSIAFILPLLSFILIITVAKKNRDNMIAGMKS